MKADQLNEFDKKDWEENESVNLHSENALELAKEFGTPEEVEAMQRIMDQHMRRGHILPHEVEERNALTSKYYSMLEHSVNPTFKSTLEGYKVLPAMDKEKYQARSGLEGPFSTLSGKVVYYDPKEGSYYDPDTDMYISYDDFQALDNDYSGMGDEEADDFVKDIEPKETVKGPRGHLRSIVADDLNEIDCWDGYKKDGTKPGTGKNKGKRVNNCVKEAGGYYTQPVYDMIEKYGYEKVMHELLTKLHADVIQDFISRVDLEEVELDEATYRGYEIKRQNRKDGHPLIIPDLKLTGTDMKDVKRIIDRHLDENIEEGGEGSGPKHKEVTVTKDGKSKVVKKIAAKVFTDAGWKVETDLNEFGPDERYMKVGNNTMIANKKTGSISSTLSLGGDKTATVNNHLNRDGSAGKVSARGTVNVSGTPVKFKASNNISGNNFKGSVSAGGMTVNASKKPKMKKEGKYVSDAQRKAVHASKAEKK